MACPDWHRLAAARDASPGDPPGWDDAVAHLDGCAACRGAAVVADPTLVFRRLPALTVGTDEVEAMLVRVAALRGARGVGRPLTSRRLPRPYGRWQPAAAAAALAFAALAGGHAPPGAPRVATVPGSVGSLALAAEISAQPLLEELDRPFDQVMQWNTDEMSVVLVVDERLDV
jgi:hypothetical protein